MSRDNRAHYRIDNRGRLTSRRSTSPVLGLAAAGAMLAGAALAIEPAADPGGPVVVQESPAASVTDERILCEPLPGSTDGAAQ